jgi:hypothetical protein
MGSQYPPGSYDQDTLKAIEGVFRDVWDHLPTSNPSHDTDREGLKVAIIDQLLGLVEQGITDPLAMREVVLRVFMHRCSCIGLSRNSNSQGEPCATS